MPSELIAEILLGAYLFASIPFGLLVGFLWKRVDIRQFGSGNIGASNVLRLLGWPAALVVLMLDTAKGFAPVWFAIALTDNNPLMAVGAGLAAILGHNFSLFLKFKGGKGVATSLGVLIGLSPEIAVIALFIWILVVSVTRFISVASIATGISVPILMWLSARAHTIHLSRPMAPEYIYLGLLGAGFILLKHRSNLVRLVNGTEPRIGQKIHSKCPSVHLDAGARKSSESAQDSTPEPGANPQPDLQRPPDPRKADRRPE
ncbi:MAG: glycerol-3-phosphate 1-O-acyltransferase PlsY [Armatimonadetes bacterium]|nr:glycerol-3-phosphate 1-O-acyltransferase PlsY [Armatimonadota bacterium]